MDVSIGFHVAEPAAARVKAMAPHEVERREMVGRLAIDLLAGGIDRRAGGGDAEVLHQRLVGPRRDIRRLGAQQRDLLPELGDRPRLLADHLVLFEPDESIAVIERLGHVQAVAVTGEGKVMCIERSSARLTPSTALGTSACLRLSPRLYLASASICGYPND
jgi:hypothetical protein